MMVLARVEMLLWRTLKMPRLLRADVEKLSVRVLKLFAREKGIVKCIIAESRCDVVEMGLSA